MKSQSRSRKQAKKPSAPNIVNRRAKFDYALEDNLTVGLVLTGKEVRAVRDGRVQLKGSFVTIRGNELWLNNASFSIKNNERGVPGAITVDTKPKKLLATRKQITELATKKQQGTSIVPVKILANRRHIKLIIATGKGKKMYDKRETIKRRDSERDAKRAMKLR